MKTEQPSYWSRLNSNTLEFSYNCSAGAFLATQEGWFVKLIGVSMLLRSRPSPVPKSQHAKLGEIREWMNKSTSTK